MRRLAALLLALAALPAAAQTVVVSPAPDRTSVTLYRAPDRDADDAIDRDDPDGYALVTETRTVTVPPGPAVIRFEGVAGNIFPETALVGGLPAEVREKNLDADLLSPRTLYDRALGRRVLLRRTDPATGRVTKEQAVIRSLADGAAVLQTGAGYEALRCSGLKEQLVFPEAPPGLTARPTLSIAIDGGTGGVATLTLSYLAGGFDWQADYVVRLHPGGRKAELFAWVTLASSDVTSFTDANAQVVAGKPHRDAQEPPSADLPSGALQLKCWPEPDNGSDRGGGPPPPPAPPPPPPPPPPPMAMRAEAMDVVVTGARMATQEELGDLKLYRLPDSTTVAAKAQKQVAMLSKNAVALREIYASDVAGDDVDDPVLVLRGRNRLADGLGVPLPAGKVAVFQEGGPRPILLGEAAIDDKAVDEEVEFKLGDTPNVAAEADAIGKTGRTTRYRLTVTNANARPITFEARFTPTPGRFRAAAKLGERDGRKLWTVTVPANGTRSLGYTITSPVD